LKGVNMEDKNIELIIIKDKIRSRYLKKDVKFICDGILKEEINAVFFPNLSIAKESIPNFDKDYILSTLPLLNDDFIISIK